LHRPGFVLANFVQLSLNDGWMIVSISSSFIPQILGAHNLHVKLDGVGSTFNSILAGKKG